MNNKFDEMTLEELQQKKKKLTGAVVRLGIVVLIAMAVLVYVIFKSKNFAFTAIIPACLLTFLPSLIYLGQLRTEIRSRNAK